MIGARGNDEETGHTTSRVGAIDPRGRGRGDHCVVGSDVGCSRVAVPPTRHESRRFPSGLDRNRPRRGPRACQNHDIGITCFRRRWTHNRAPRDLSPRLDVDHASYGSRCLAQAVGVCGDPQHPRRGVGRGDPGGQGLDRRARPTIQTQSSATADNIALVARWIDNEGGLWADNPLNTSAGSGSYPHQYTSGGQDTGIPVFPTMATGVEAAVTTLLSNQAYARASCGCCGRDPPRAPPLPPP